MFSRRRFLTVSAAGLIAASLPGAPATAQQGTRTAAYTLGGTNRAFPPGRLSLGSVNVRHVVRLPVATVRWRLRIANYQRRDESPVRGRARLTSAWFGPHETGENGG